MRPNDYNDLLKKIKCTDDFRSRMQQKLSSASVETAEYADSVSGTDVITVKHRFGRAAALAAAFVLVCGAVGGGAYHLANVNKTTKESSDISEAVQYSSIYSRLKANKELYHGDLVFKQDSEVKLHSSGLDIEPFISYMDKFDTDNMIDAEDFDETGRSITIDFYEKKCDEEFAAKLEQAANDETINRISLYDEASYNFTLYNNGCYTMTDNEYNRTTYHCFTDGEKVLNDILEMYVDDEMLERINTVSKTEMMTALQKGFDNYNDGKAYYYPANSNEPIDCIIGDRSGFRDELWEFEWERAGIPSGDVDHYYLGFTINVDGYMQIYIDDMENNYKLKNDSDLEAFRAVLAKHLQPNDHWTNASEDVFDNIINEVNKSRESYNTLSGTFSMGFQGGSVNYVVDGTLKYDRVNDELYFYSEGSENGYENAVDHTVVEEAKTGGKMIMSRGSYCYESDGNSPRESKIFCDNVYDEVEEWLESRKLSENKYNIEKNTFDNGYTTYAIGSIDENKKDDIDIMNFVLDEKGRLISVNKAVLYSIGDEAHDIRMRTFYTLNEFEFDPPDFDGSDIPEKYNEMKQRLGDELNKWS